MNKTIQILVIVILVIVAFWLLFWTLAALAVGGQ